VVKRNIILTVFTFALIVMCPFYSAQAEVKANAELPYKELIFTPGKLNSPHAPSIVELPGGELFAVWYASVNSSQVIWASRKSAGAQNWTEPVIIHKTPGYGSKNPVLYLEDNKKLFLFWADEKRWFKIVIDRLRMKTSDDFGRTWDEPRSVGKLSRFLPRNHPIKLQDGRIILPVYADISTSSAVAISKDGGLTWDGPKYILYFLGTQPTIIQRSDLSLFTMMRTGMWPRKCWQAVSKDMGNTWQGRSISNINNPGSSLEMLKLKSGNVVLAFNDSKKGRKSFSLALSRDEGKTWPYVKTIECSPDNNYSYPSLIQDSKGLIHVVYSYVSQTSIAHFVTDEQWFMK
jgi:hypothetical protein